MEMHLGIWDWLVIIFYFIFIVGIGFLFKHVNRNVSDYFRGGGNMLWWIAGMSAIAASISTWSFTGASAKVYQSGFLLPMAWLIGIPISVVLLWFMAPRFRQMRVITSIEAIARRYGFGSEQFYVYLLLPMGLFWGGIGMNTVAVFMAAALGIDIQVSLIGLGIIVTTMALFGGQWAVAASDFVQGLLMFLTVLVVVFFSLRLPEIGGLTNLRESLPDRHFNFTVNARLEIVVLWIAVMQAITIFNTLNLNTEGAKYLQVKDARQARGMIVLRFILLFVFPLSVIMQIPAMCAATVFPNMASIFPDLKVPEEGAFLAMAFKTLPQGMMGLLVCGMFAAAMSSMDTALNRNAGYFVRNIYIKYIERTATEKKQLVMGKVFTLVFGVITVLIGLSFNHLREMNLFDVFQILNSMVWIPSLVPTALGVIYKKTPGWTGWSTVLVGLATGAIAKKIYSPELIQSLLGYDSPINDYEIADSQFVFIATIVFCVTVGWFFFTSLFYKKTSEKYRDEVEAFFNDMKTPIDHAREDVRDQDAMQYRLVGIMALVFGGFILLGILIPNPFWGRLCFLFVGSILFAIGAILYRISVKKFREHPDAEI